MNRPSARISRARLALLLLAIVSLVLAGCGPKVIVLRQAVVNPMTPRSSFYLQTASFAGLTIHGIAEAEWMRRQGPQAAARWEANRVAMNTTLAEGLGFGNYAYAGFTQAKDPAGAFQIATDFVRYEPDASPALIAARVSILDPQGAVVDEIEVDAFYGGSSADENARGCARSVGVQIAVYLSRRTGLKK
jgi:hypothetical protein